MILCCGEALIDMIPFEATDGSSGYSPHPGGAIFNTAIALGRLGVHTHFLSGLSTDLFGQMITKALGNSLVDSRLCIQSSKPTTLAFVSLTDGHSEYTFYDENTAGRSLVPDQVPELPRETSTLYIGGISLCSEPCADFYEAIATQSAPRCVLMIDPNIRTSFIENEPRYRARLERLIALADILKVSDQDLHWIIPGPQSLEEKLRAIANSGPCLTILTVGEAGAQCLGPDGISVSIPAARANVIDTVGAGDTFNAGILAKLSELGLLSKPALTSVSALALSEVLAFGARVAAITVSRSGANPPWADELADS